MRIGICAEAFAGEGLENTEEPAAKERGDSVPAGGELKQYRSLFWKLLICGLAAQIFRWGAGTNCY